ncbi:unnamed protein product, partial [Didymodactylos carnosus]
ASSRNFYVNLRQKYDEVVSRSVRKLEKLVERHQKSICDAEFIRLCLIYNLVPTFIGIKLWKKKLTSQQQHITYQKQLLKFEYNNRHNDSLQFQKDSLKLLNELKGQLAATELEIPQQQLLHIALKTKQNCLQIHNKKLE